MKNMFQIAHISDPHLSRQYYRENIKSFKMLLRAILNEGADHIIISGDIVSTADEDDYYLAREILSSNQLLDSSRLTIVPGNHDIFGGPHRAADILSFPQNIRSVDYTRHHELFQNAFAETFQGVTRLNETNLFPFIKTAGPFNLIGLNSIPPWSFRHNPLGTNGVLDDQQFDSLEKLTSHNILEDRTTIVVVHHHFNDLVQSDYEGGRLWTKIESNTMRMKKRKKIIRIFQSLNVRYVLHGHLHRNEIYDRSGILFANGAGAVCDDPVKFLKYNILQYADGYCNIRIRQLPIPYQISTVTAALHRNHIPLTIPAFAGKPLQSITLP
jgi:3',5'-cyclic AMP phosphodiesterase CpdA